MKPAKIVIGVIVGYVGLVVAFETLIGILQPQAGDVLVITTYDENGTAHERVVSTLESDGELYVAANHWPRAWYRRALANPEVHVERDGESGDYRAVPITGAEYEQVNGEHALPFAFRFVTGFPPRHLLRLEPSGTAEGSDA